MGLQGKWALVCGASKGLGLGCAQALAAEGVNVVMVARGAEALQAAAENIRAANAIRESAGGQKSSLNVVLAVAADITSPDGRAAALGVAGGPGTAFDCAAAAGAAAAAAGALVDDQVAYGELGQDHVFQHDRDRFLEGMDMAHAAHTLGRDDFGP